MVQKTLEIELILIVEIKIHRIETRSIYNNRKVRFSVFNFLKFHFKFYLKCV